MTSLKKFQFILSYAFSKSIFMSSPFKDFVESSCITSCSTITPSRIFLPFMNVVWVPLITLSATVVSLSVKSLVCTL
uniref:Uncharacterized protein n=1 Tax=Arundo donax TaxID=35708 RepID=A0A0A9AUE3_ARUDO